LEKQRSSFILNKYLLGAAGILFLVSTLELFDLVELPFESFLAGSSAGGLASSIILFMQKNAYPALFVLMFLESASLPIPSELYLPFTGYLIYTGVMNFPLALIVATVSGVLGALVDFYMGLLLGKVFVNRLAKYLMVSEKSIERAEKWISSKGMWSIFAARFVPGLRSIISFPAGILNMEIKRFVLTTSLGTFGWSLLLIYVGFTAGKLWDAAIANLERATNELAVILVAVVSGLYIAYYAKKKLFKQTFS
jgi:membrane protein DedA with SNARE-associated domain